MNYIDFIIILGVVIVVVLICFSFRKKDSCKTCPYNKTCEKKNKKVH